MDVMQFTKPLREERMKVWNEAKGLLDHVGAEHREMNAEENAQWKRMNERLEEIDNQVRDVEAAEVRTRDAAAARDAFDRQYGTGSGARDEVREGDMIRRFLRGEAVGDINQENGRRILHVPVSQVRREFEFMRQGASPMEARNMAWDTGSSGSLVPTTLARSVYQYLEASMAVWRAPTTKIPTTSGEPFQFPRVAAHAIATQVAAQGTALAGTDPTFGKMQLDAFKYGELVMVPNELIQDSTVDISAFLGKDMGRALGRVIGTDLAVGSGSGKPNGIMTALSGGGAGSVTTGGSLIAPTYEKLIDTQYAVTDEYRTMSSVGWLMKDSTAATIRKLRSDAGGTTGPTLWEPSLTQGLVNGQPDRLLGDPVYRDVNVAAAGSNARIIAYGDFSAYYIRHVGDIVIEQDTSYAFNTDQTAVRAKWRIDGDLIDNLAMVTLLQNV